MPWLIIDRIIDSTCISDDHHEDKKKSNTISLGIANLENLESCNVQYADERGSLSFGPVEWFVDPQHDPLEHPLITCLADGLNCIFDLIYN